MFIESIRMLLPANWIAYTYSDSLLSHNSNLMYHAALIDMYIEHDEAASGPEYIQRIKKALPHAAVIGMSGNADLNLMEKCLEYGAFRFLSKPFEKEDFQNVLHKVEAQWNLRQSAQSTPEIVWVGSGPQSQRLRQQVAALKGETGSILVEGETGCGKEVVVRLLNQQESGRPLYSVNLAAISESLFESEFFGHKKGSFTGADKDRVGICKLANKGDLFLDEIEALPMSQQAKLLRFLETGEFRPIGSRDSEYSEVRVISATNVPLQNMVKAGLFREDLYFRLRTHIIRLAPLRNRFEDLYELSHFFLGQIKPKRNKLLSPEALELMKNYEWPGNVRELKKFCTQISLASPLPIIRSNDVEDTLERMKNNQYSQPSTTSSHPSPELSLKIDTKNSLPISNEGAQKISESGDSQAYEGFDEIMMRYEGKILRQAYQSTNGDIDKMVSKLRISRSTLYRKLKALDIGNL